MGTRPDEYTNKQAAHQTKQTKAKQKSFRSVWFGVGWLGFGRCSLRQSRERATFLLFVSRPMSGEASRSETRHERGEGPAFQEEGADGITLYNDKRHAATTLDLGMGAQV